MSTRFTLPVAGRLDVEHALGVLQVHSLPNQEKLDPERATLTRILGAAGGSWRTTLSLHPGRVEVETEAGAQDATQLGRIITDWLGLEQPGAPALERLASDELLGAAALHCPHLRLLSYPDLFEALATTVLGQQISTRAARTLATRYTEAVGVAHASGLRSFPRADATVEVSAASLARIIGCPLSRAATLRAVARWHLEEYPALATEPGRVRASLLQLPGVGPWTADYVLLRGLRDPRILLASDLVVRRSLQRLGFTGDPRALDWGRDNSIATVLLWQQASLPAG